MEIVLVGLVLGTLGVLWQRLGKPWCDRVSDAARYPRLTRVGLVALLYAGAIASLGVLAYAAQLAQSGFFGWAFLRLTY